MKMPIDLIQFRKNYLMKKIAGLPTGRITDIEVKGTIYMVSISEVPYRKKTK